MIDFTNEREFNALVGLIEKGLVEGNPIGTLHELRRAVLEIASLRAEVARLTSENQELSGRLAARTTLLREAESKVARLAAEVEARPSITPKDAAVLVDATTAALGYVATDVNVRDEAAFRRAIKALRTHAKEPKR